MYTFNTEQQNAYLNRIFPSNSSEVEFSKLKPTLEVLEMLHEAHVFSIPFETLAIHLGKPVSLKLEDILKKLVTEKKGGWCYEQNLLFYHVLRSIGFEVSLQKAQPKSPDAQVGFLPPRHAILLVVISDAKYLVDVGFGRNGLIKPLSLATSEIQQVYSTQYRIIKQNLGYLFQVLFNKNFNTEYRFSLSEDVTINDYEEFNSWISNSEESPFVNNIVVTKPTKTGRIFFTNKELKLIDNGFVTKVTVESAKEYLEILKQHFAIDLSLDSKFLPPIPSRGKPVVMFNNLECDIDTPNPIILLSKNFGIFKEVKNKHTIENSPKNSELTHQFG